MLVFGRWTAEWTLMLWAAGVTAVSTIFVMVMVGRVFLRRRVFGQLPDIAHAEIARRDELIGELRGRCTRIEREDAELRGMLRGIVSIGTGVTEVSNAAAAERPTLRKAK